MKTAGLTEAKDALSSLVAYARRGGRVRILVRGVPAADLVPIDVGDGGGADDAELLELERQGLVRRGKGGVASLLSRPGPKARGVVDALLAERRSGR